MVYCIMRRKKRRWEVRNAPFSKMPERIKFEMKQQSRLNKDNLWPASIVDCVIEGEWDVCKERNMTFKLRNHVYISDLVKYISCDVSM